MPEGSWLITTEEHESSCHAQVSVQRSATVSQPGAGPYLTWVFKISTTVQAQRGGGSGAGGSGVRGGRRQWCRARRTGGGVAVAAVHVQTMGWRAVGLGSVHLMPSEGEGY